MVTITCKLKLPDGEVITGTVKARAAEDDYLIEYTGPVERLPEKLDEASVPYLGLNFKNWAKELNAELEIQTSGQYDEIMDDLSQ